MAGDRISAIQGYRFLLFFAVFLFHCASSWFSVGWGVFRRFWSFHRFS